MLALSNGRVDPHRRALEGSKGRAFDVAGEADAGKPTLGARPGAGRLTLLVARRPEGLAENAREVAAVRLLEAGAAIRCNNLPALVRRPEPSRGG